ncbi:hypothetical protein A2755_00195 [Candidatus Wolfebacteria bacterium RIFCSPHIGHO2_01_FULL_48_22]|uniref:Uncharacterized protein n=2 Tax=Candidatus Wolfeibacteriota TaxID=1752735 RepID=A0A1F8DQA6_9BACT|nr:MAG: hypothetical protein A2755_00195 [Candidatus Wolfebacteria bacterium RIFCSPHIGHO2_01_FULL_48_22]OGM93418.1 MAG: hypothetical protein A2935_04150 [Candidatus Wolfebacteria bacterium RIFCSPLOWO2_01_FULL_47_17b]
MEDTFKGVVIEESLEDTSVLKDVNIVSTKVEPVTDTHKTPWVSQWTLHTIEVPRVSVKDFAERISHSLDQKHNWYADFKDDTHHYIVFRDKVFYIDRKSKEQYDEATQYGLALGIQDYQLDFSPHVKVWER